MCRRGREAGNVGLALKPLGSRATKVENTVGAEGSIRGEKIKPPDVAPTSPSTGQTRPIHRKSDGVPREPERPTRCLRRRLSQALRRWLLANGLSGKTGWTLIRLPDAWCAVKGRWLATGGARGADCVPRIASTVSTSQDSTGRVCGPATCHG